jgi:FkbM family methyltransferase
MRYTFVDKVIRYLARYCSGRDLLGLAYRDMGILNYENPDVSGERWLIESFLAKELCAVEQPVLFDVGANVGKIARLLRSTFPDAVVWAFEPNPDAFKKLQEATSASGVQVVPKGVGAVPGTDSLYLPEGDEVWEGANVHPEMMRDRYRMKKVRSVPFEIVSLDDFCADQGVDRIDFLKIDVEGLELEVLRGAARMLAEGRLGIIQFEFGECDIFSRVFLRDFYQLLTGYRFARLCSAGLLDLGPYRYENEIFRHQNIIACPIESTPAQ